MQNKFDDTIQLKMSVIRGRKHTVRKISSQKLIRTSSLFSDTNKEWNSYFACLSVCQTAHVDNASSSVTYPQKGQRQKKKAP
jgi:hypothetical protein